MGYGMVEQYVSKGAPGEGLLIFGTLAPGDIFITPPAWITAEKVIGKDSCIGLRKSFLNAGDKEGSRRLAVVKDELAANNKTRTQTYQILEQAVKILTSAAEDRVTRRSSNAIIQRTTA